MKRDMDLVRTIILTVRETDKPVEGIPGVEPHVFAEHVQLLVEAGLIDAQLYADSPGVFLAAIIWRLTWSGQDFADAILSDTVWNKAKEAVLKPAAGWTFGILLDYLKFEIRRHVPGLGVPQ